MIAPVLKWNHEADHFVPYFDPTFQFSRRNMTINLNDKNFEFMKGHMIGGRVLFPAAGWIFYVWETFAMMLGKSFEKLKVVIHDIKFLQTTVLSKNNDINITISIHRSKCC